jgi:hypothetical protein
MKLVRHRRNADTSCRFAGSWGHPAKFFAGSWGHPDSQDDGATGREGLRDLQADGATP